MSSTDTETETGLSASWQERIIALERQVEFLSKERPGRKMKPNITSAQGVCGIDPTRDSATCPDASIYRYQQGCQGVKCVKINRDYYAEYRLKRKQSTKPLGIVEQEALPEAPPNGTRQQRPVVVEEPLPTS